MSNNASCRATRKEIVTTLMTFVGRETRKHRSKDSEHVASKEYISYRCPKPICASPTVSFLDKSGFHNPYAHLRACYGRGLSVADQDALLHRMYEAAIEAARMKGGTIRSHFESKSLSEYDKTLHAYLRMIVMKSLPLYYIEDSEVRRFSRFETKIGQKTLVEVILKLVELVEKRIAIEMKGTKEAILFDGWTCNNMHFIAVIASYCTTPTYCGGSSVSAVSIPRLSLLALSPMGHVSDVDADEYAQTDETATFNAQAHVQFFKEIFPFFGQDFNEWCICLIGDNCSTNRRVADITGKKYVGCNSHKLNLEVNYMVDAHAQLRSTIDRVHATMRGAKKLKNSALLRNLTPLSPIMHNATRWSGKLHMLARFVRIREELIEVQQAPEGDLVVDTSAALLSLTQRFVNMLSELDVIIKSLQTRGHTLAQCRDDLDVLLDAVYEQHNQVGSPLFHCKLSNKYIAPSAAIVLHPEFESGVVKIQKGLQSHLTVEEQEAVSCLLKTTGEDEGTNASANATPPPSTGMAERLQKKRKNCEPQRYIDSNFILGSVAEVERLWSIAKHVLTENRRSMTPQIFEAVLFLKINQRFWDEQLVAEAIHGMRSDRVAASLQQHETQGELDSLHT